MSEDAADPQHQRPHGHADTPGDCRSWTRSTLPRPLDLVLVLIGGTAGTAAREALSLRYPWVGAVPYAVLAANLLGACALGVLLETLTRRALEHNHGERQTSRLLLGTGFLGGFTTYSALATDSAHLIGTGRAEIGFGYAVVTVVLGAAATWAGIAVAARVRQGRSHTKTS